MALGIYVNEMQRSLTGLGDVPTDFEAAPNMCYTPVWQQWYYGIPVNPALQRRPPEPPPRPVPLLVPPSGRFMHRGWDTHGGPVLGQAANASQLAQEAANGSAAAQRAIVQLARVEKQTLWISMISAASIATMAIFTIVQGVRGARRC